ncbi:glycosyltransferase family 2 protein [Microbacterium sp. SLBN-111]|uniref:glycosyltransferase family 2 protein n=1 Tax=Microbacterium sp. SLBN-111 TaxID=3377733 RepID=UPI003C74A85D
MPAESDALPRVTVVTVTYADRWATGLSATVQSVLAEPRADLIVVCNGIAPASAASLTGTASAAAGRIEVIDLGRNRGSAPAFATGLAAAYRRATAVLLLDDDNPLPPGALATLEAVSDALTSRADAAPTALACFRAVNPVYRLLKEGAAADTLFRELRPGAFLTTDVFASRHRAAVDPRRTIPTAVGDIRVTPLPNSMWGGLYLPPGIAALGVLPPTELVLYADDNAFSARLRGHGCEILLCLDVEIRDTVDWRASAEPPRRRVRIPRVLRTAPDELWRVRYQNRNAAFVSALQARGSVPARMRLAVNVAARLSLLFLAALAAGRLRAFGAVATACLAGLRGRLGESYPLPGGADTGTTPARVRSARS